MTGSPRPEVVQAVFDALTKMDPSLLLGLDHVTPDERAEREALFVAGLDAGRDQRDRDDAALIWLADQGHLRTPMTEIERDYPEIWAEYERRRVGGEDGLVTTL